MPAALLGSLCVALAGCGAQGPSDKTVEDAVKDRMTRDGSQGVRLQVNSVEVRRCIRAGSDHKFTCTVEVDFEIGKEGRRKASGDISMLKVPNGWTYEGGMQLQ